MANDFSRDDFVDGEIGELDRKDLEEILDTGRELQAEKENFEKAKQEAQKKADESRARKILESENIHESVRDLVMGEIKTHIEATEKPEAAKSGKSTSDLIKKRRRELRELLENLGDELAGKSPKEVAATLASFLDLTSQLSLQKTEGVITVRCRLGQFFYPKDYKGSIPPEMRAEVSLMFTPEEVEAIRVRLETSTDDDPMKDFFTSVLDQAFDVVQYNEMTGMLLVEMTSHFLEKLDDEGFDRHPKYLEFKERHERTMSSLSRAIQELRDVNITINNHLKDHPVLEDFPKALRLLIQVRLGMLPKSMVPELIDIVKSKQGAYSRARGAVAFDFNRLPSFQHGVRLRQSAILNLHKDVLKFTGDQFEAEFGRVKEEFEKMMSEIDAASETLDPNSPEYEQMMKQKELLQKKISEHRRKLDVVKSQERLVDVQHSQIQASIERFVKNDPMAQKAQELHDQAKIDPSKTREKQTGESTRKKATRMATAAYRGGR